ncbi:MAG: hypothetical protein A2Y15_00070 [Clostridiales bacterium GWF2_36_10]|nr:MAG: hypothetical protein A2Y15_00070 [Clostridiales bacterium GWF2_36_10]HAN20246.1 hypothetical protein [Clostridiales bacterium]
MKDKNILFEHMHFEDTQIMAMKEYLERRAFTGWRLKEYKKKFIFEKISSSILTYTVLYYEKEVPGLLDFIESSENAGWKFITQFDNFLVFLQDRVDALPLVSGHEPVVEEKEKKSIWSYISLVYHSIAIYFLSINSLYTIFTNYIYIIFVYLLILNGFSNIVSIAKTIVRKILKDNKHKEQTTFIDIKNKIIVY